MNKNTIITILSILLGVMAITFIVKEISGGWTQSPPPPPPPPPPPRTSVTNDLPKIKSGDIERIRSEADEPQVMTSIFEANGKGTYAKWGGAADADIYYLLKLKATSKVESKEQSDSGKIRIQEIRTFHEATEVIKPAKVNLRVDLSTLPLDQIETTGYLLGGLVSIFSPNTGAGIGTAVAGLREQIDALEGQEGRPIMDLLGQFGIDINKIVNEPIESYLN